MADEFIAKFSAAMDAVVVGDPLDPATVVGPLVSAAQKAEVSEQVADALAKGVADAKIAPALIAQEALGPTLTPATLHAITLAESPAQGLALFLTAPEFRRR